MKGMVDRQDSQGSFTYADYLTWPDDERWEIIDGVAYDMTPAPRPRHQELLVNLLLQIGNFLEGHPCMLYPAPFDVRIPDGDDTADSAISSVVQPDISVICDRHMIDDRGLLGAPDLAAEILSPSTAYKDQTVKLSLFERAGVREYWVVNPERKCVLVYLQPGGEGGFERATEYRAPEARPSAALGGLDVDLGRGFEE